MSRHTGKLFAFAEETAQEAEDYQVLAQGPGIHIERIVSRGQVSPAGEWYDQDQDEWVVLLQGRAELCFEGGRTHALAGGDWILLPAHQRHRVTATSSDPPCVWLAVHGPLGPVDSDEGESAQ